MSAKRVVNSRLDKALVELGLARSRDHAIELIALDSVLINGSIAQKPDRRVMQNDQLSLKQTSKQYVGRGAYKLAGALDRLNLSVDFLIVADIGSSTGGFTQILLERGAKSIVAIDVGINQMSERIRGNPAIVLLEGVNARLMDRTTHTLPIIDLVVGDVSFISLCVLVPCVKDVLLQGVGRFVLLVKPQFELGRQVVSKGRGVVKDPLNWRQAIIRVAECYIDNGASIDAIIPSSLAGSMGNREFFISGSFTTDNLFEGEVDLNAMIDEAFALLENL